MSETRYPDLTLALGGILSLARIRMGGRWLIGPSRKRHNRHVLEMIFLLVRAVALACRGHHELVLENLALRQLERVETHEQPSTPLEPRSAVLDRVGRDVAEFARGARAGSARHRGAMAPRLGPPALDAAIGAASCRSPEDRRRHSHSRHEDGPEESTLGARWAEWASRS